MRSLHVCGVCHTVLQCRYQTGVHLHCKLIRGAYIPLRRIVQYAFVIIQAEGKSIAQLSLHRLCPRSLEAPLCHSLANSNAIPYKDILAQFVREIFEDNGHAAHNATK